jgi:RNA 3'-terminal phosphate cyclase (ATP)
LERGELLHKEAMVTCCKIPKHVPEREIQVLSQHLNWPNDVLKSQWVTAIGGGNVISLRLFYQNCSEVIDMLGKRGLPSHIVAEKAVKQLQHYLQTEAPISEYLADQLLLPMALGKGGIFRTVRPSLHTLTNQKVIEMFSDKRFQCDEVEKGIWEIVLEN